MHSVGSNLSGKGIMSSHAFLINNDQTGFLKGRFIGENIRLIDSVINYTAVKKITGLLFFLDFEKAFDTLELPFIQKNTYFFQIWPFHCPMV